MFLGHFDVDIVTKPSAAVIPIWPSPRWNIGQ